MGAGIEFYSQMVVGAQGNLQKRGKEGLYEPEELKTSGEHVPKKSTKQCSWGHIEAEAITMENTWVCMRSSEYMLWFFTFDFLLGF